MLSKLVDVGNRVELQLVERFRNVSKNKKIYQSEVYDILSDDKLEITMPIEQTKLILLPVDSECDVVLYGKGGLYQCFARIVDRYKTNNVYILVLELVTNLRKYQRRDYYRYSCALEMYTRELEEAEITAIEQNDECELLSGLPMDQSLIIDLSGGGLRFLASKRYEAKSLVCCTFHLSVKGRSKKYEILGKILSVRRSDSKLGSFEHRVQYINMEENVREEIIKYIFEEERKERRKEWDLK